MNLKFLDRKYAPLYLLAAGIIVFAGAFFYASKKGNSEPNEVSDESTLTTPGVQNEVAGADTEVSETPVATVTSSTTPKITKAVSTSTPVPTQAPTFSPSPTPTSTPQSSTETPTPSLTPTQTPTPTTELTPTIAPTGT